jgi:hypothetical protein
MYFIIFAPEIRMNYVRKVYRQLDGTTEEDNSSSVDP